MPITEEVTFASAFRESPVRMAVFTLGPVVLAVAQLLNSVFAELALWASICFAATMVSYAVLYSRYHLAELRLRTLESDAVPGVVN